MKLPEITEGPWTFYQPTGCQGFTVRPKETPTKVVFHLSFCDEIHAKAAATLPDLLEVLRSIYLHGENGELHDRARAALLKAGCTE